MLSVHPTPYPLPFLTFSWIHGSPKILRLYGRVYHALTPLARGALVLPI